MAEAGTFHLRLFEWTTPTRLFMRLRSIYGDEDLAFHELSDAYTSATVKSARVPRGDFGHLLWEEAEKTAGPLAFAAALESTKGSSLGRFSRLGHNALRGVFRSLAPPKNRSSAILRQGARCNLVLPVARQSAAVAASGGHCRRYFALRFRLVAAFVTPSPLAKLTRAYERIISHLDVTSLANK